jgi:hypothetical protein
LTLQTSTKSWHENYLLHFPQEFPKLLRVCSVDEKWMRSYCSTFRCYLVKFI